MDIRLCATFIDHPKTIKLERRFGLVGLKCLLRLWMFTAQRHPKGRLIGMSGEDIEIASGWTGYNGEFFSALVELRWVDSDDIGYSIHGWEEHQSYVFFSPERSEKARVASRARYRKCSEDATSIATSIAPSNDIRDNTHPPSPSPSPVPSPNPSPSPNPKQTTSRFAPPTVEEVRAYCVDRKNTVDPERFVDHYTSNGWKVGKNGMKDWKAAVRTWEKGDSANGRKGTGYDRPLANRGPVATPGKYDHLC